MLSTSRKAEFIFLLGGADSTLYENSKAAGALPTRKHLSLCHSIKVPGGPKGGLLRHSGLPRTCGSHLATMRFLALARLLCILLLCLSVFSTEGRTLPVPRPGCWSLNRDSHVWEDWNQEMLEGRPSQAVLGPERRAVTPEPVQHLYPQWQHRGWLGSFKPLQSPSTAPAPQTHTHKN